MKAAVQYDDFVGTVAADISDFLGYSNDIDSLTKCFNIDETRFKAIGISIRGADAFFVSLLCVDKEKSIDDKEHIVSIDIEKENENLDFLFKRLHIVLYPKFDNKYSNLNCDEEITYSDCHKTENAE